MAGNKPDVIVVGAGAGGGTAARVLAQRGMDVVVLEKGPAVTAEEFLPYDEHFFHMRKALMPQVDDDPNIHVSPDGAERPVERWWIANMVGGATMVWDANMPRYTAEDMRILDHLEPVPEGAEMVNWPWSYEEFQPWFERAEHEWGVSGRSNQCSSQEPTRPGYEYPMPPLRPHASNAFVQQAFAKAGLETYLGPRAINSRTAGGRPACPFCGYNQFYGCAVNSRASAANTVLPLAVSTGRCDLRTRHCVSRVVHDRGRVTGVMYMAEPGGEERFLGADRVVVSIQAIESARLFLLSGVPDPNDMVGHYLVYHTHGNAELTFPEQPVWDLGDAYQPRTAIGSLQMRDLYVVDDPQHPEITKAGKFSIYDPLTCIPPIRLVKAAAMGPAKRNVWGEDLRAYLDELRSQGGVYFSYTGEAMSMHDNRVELDAKHRDPWGLPVARTHYRHHPYDIAACDYALQKVCTVMADAGGELRRLEPQPEDNPGYGHVQGTLRAGTDPGAAVLDENCQSHTVAGLYVLDAAWMPTSGASNPTMTLLANAYRVCDRMS